MLVAEPVTQKLVWYDNTARQHAILSKRYLSANRTAEKEDDARYIYLPGMGIPVERCQLADTEGGSRQHSVSFPFPAQGAGNTIGEARHE